MYDKTNTAFYRIIAYITRDSEESRNDFLRICITQLFNVIFNPYLTNGFTHHYQLGESTYIFRGVRGDFYFLSHFSMKFLCANRLAPDVTPQNAASYLGLYCLPMSHKRDARLK